MRKPNKISIRKTLFWTGTIVAVGLGTYFGVKKSGDKLVSVFEGIEEDVKFLTNFAGKIEADTVIDRNYIAMASDMGVKFKHYPGLGIKFDSIADGDKVRKALVDATVLNK